jgi:hypothetical protein
MKYKKINNTLFKSKKKYLINKISFIKKECKYKFFLMKIVQGKTNWVKYYNLNLNLLFID